MDIINRQEPGHAPPKSDKYKLVDNQAGKGDRPRNNHSEAFRSGYDSIDWSRPKSKDRPEQDVNKDKDHTLKDAGIVKKACVIGLELSSEGKDSDDDLSGPPLTKVPSCTEDTCESCQ